MIEWSCPECTSAISVPDSRAGQIGTCNECGSSIRIPDPDATPRQYKREEQNERNLINRVQIPAIALMVIGGLGLFAGLILLVIAVADPFAHLRRTGEGEGPRGIPLLIVSSLWGMIVLLGGYNMLNYRSRTSCLAASVFAMLPCNPFCVVGLPFGLWSITTLLDPAIRREFEARSS